jgi:hypothetical protein
MVMEIKRIKGEDVSINCHEFDQCRMQKPKSRRQLDGNLNDPSHKERSDELALSTFLRKLEPWAIGPGMVPQPTGGLPRSHQPDLRQNLRHRPNEDDDQSDNVNFGGKFNG